MSQRFSDNAMGRIARAVRWVEDQRPAAPTRRNPGRPAYEFFIGKTDGSGIPARSGTTPGSGTVTLYHLDTDTTTLTVQQDSSNEDVEVTCYNLSTEAVAASSYVMIQQEYITGTFWAVWEDC